MRLYRRNSGQEKDPAHLKLPTFVAPVAEFLSELDVMDYSLLIGVDKDQRVLVVGLIDFIRQVRRADNVICCGC